MDRPRFELGASPKPRARYTGFNYRPICTCNEKEDNLKYFLSAEKLKRN